MRDNSGQVAIEYILIFTVSLILLIVFTLPLSELAVKNTLDVSDTLDAKSDLSKIAQAVKEVYGQGQGSRQTFEIASSKDVKVNVANNYVSCTLKLKDGSSKVEKIYFKSTLQKSTLYISKDENSIVIDWPIDSENMQIYSKKAILYKVFLSITI